jgi:Protein of unknown function (DUF721).
MPLAEDSDGMLSAFRGIKGARSLGTPPVAAAAVTNSVLSDLNLGQINPLEIIHENWNAIIPPRFIGLCEPSDISATVLYVRTHNAAAKQELMFEERKIRAKISLLDGCSKIRKIKFL